MSLLLLVSTPDMAFSFTQGDLYRQAKAATVLIVGINDESNALSFGSGVFISEQGLVLTNAHVVEDSTRLFVYIRNQAIDPAATGTRDRLRPRSRRAPRPHGPPGSVPSVGGGDSGRRHADDRGRISACVRCLTHGIDAACVGHSDDDYRCGDGTVQNGGAADSLRANRGDAERRE